MGPNEPSPLFPYVEASSASLSQHGGFSVLLNPAHCPFEVARTLSSNRYGVLRLSLVGPCHYVLFTSVLGCRRYLFGIAAVGAAFFTPLNIRPDDFWLFDSDKKCG